MNPGDLSGFTLLYALSLTRMITDMLRCFSLNTDSQENLCRHRVEPGQGGVKCCREREVIKQPDIEFGQPVVLGQGPKCGIQEGKRSL